MNINIHKNKSTKISEIDILVIFANRAIVLQAKAKKLTIKARQGDDYTLRKDFKKAIQDAYDQGLTCAKSLQDKNVRFFDSQKQELKLTQKYKEIYIFCVVSEHYPSLGFQARDFLQYETDGVLMPPLVMDVFSLDVMTEMLTSPLHFINYINKRVLYHEKIFAERELTILSYHLTNNLWLEDYGENSHIRLSDDVAVDLDIAMLARRDNAPASDTPKGILTEYKNTFFDFIIKDIERMENPSTIELGFFLLSISGDTIDYLNNEIQKLLNLYSHDNKHHDLSVILSNNQVGITIHCNPYKSSDAMVFLEKHCEIKKYQSKSNLWFGLSINPNSGQVRFGCNLNYQWQPSEEMEAITKSFLSLKPIESNKNDIYGRKIGRNEKCPCGSGKKYKKCCLVD